MRLGVLLLLLQLVLSRPLGFVSVPYLLPMAESAAPNVTCLVEERHYHNNITAIAESIVNSHPYWKDHGVFGFYVRELKTGYQGGFNAIKLDDEGLGYFQTASTAKLFMGCAAAYLDYTGEIDLDASIYDPVTKRNYQLREITAQMISHSVNDYFNVLLRYIGVERVNEVIRSLGAKHTTIFCELLPGSYVNREINIKRYGTTKAPRTTPRDLGLFLELVYNKAFGAENSELLMNALLDCIYDSRIPRSIDYAVPVAHKTGSHSYSYNDAGIVLLPDNPYIVVVQGYFIDSSGIPLLRAFSRAVYHLEQKRAELLRGSPLNRLGQVLSYMRERTAAKQ